MTDFLCKAGLAGKLYFLFVDSRQIGAVLT